MSSQKTVLTVDSLIDAPVEKVWDFWTSPEHIIHWNSASEDWFTPKAENDLRVGGKFASRMEARDGSMGFDFGGVYDVVNNHEAIEYTLGDGRKVQIRFQRKGEQTHVTETFEAENTNSIEMQQYGWQAIMNSFKKYTEEN